ncbi:MAG: hypothetical protein HQM08_07065 [Candidatus Riflebacteria bacterium]|nr:hypothetical protein [Candidatus Riflebacteria bacterium]
MKRLVSFLLAVIVTLIFQAPIIEAATEKGPFPIDGTQFFQEKVDLLLKNVSIQSKAEKAKKLKAPAPVPKNYKIGDEETFWASNVANNTQYQLKATLKAIGPNSYIFLENGRNVSDADIQRIENDFEGKVYNTDTKYFGQEWKPGIDGDPRMTLLLLDIQDGFTATGTNQGFVAGYFFAGDEFLQADIPANIQVKSNEREMIYLDIYPGNPSKPDYLAVVAHEFTHMIHFAHNPQEATWVKEGCAMIAMYYNGYGHQSQITSFLQQPDTSLTAWAQDHSISNYGAGYLFNFYLNQRFLKDDASKVNFYQNLISSKVQGIDSLDAGLKQYGTDFAQFYTDFAITNFVNNPNLDKGEYCYNDPLLNKLRLPVTQMIKSLPGQVQDKVFIWSADGIKVDLSTAKANVKIDFAGAHPAFTDGKYLSYKVAAVLSDSRDRVTPEISFVNLVAAADNKTQSGSLEVPSAGKFDTLTIIVSAQAPAGIPDQGYAKAPGMPYVVAVSDSGAQIARSVNSITNVSALVQDYSNAATGLSSDKEDVQLQALNSLEAISYEVTKSVKHDLENGSTKSVDDLITALQKADSKDLLKPLAKKVADQLNAQQAQGKTQLSDKIQTLLSY